MGNHMKTTLEISDPLFQKVRGFAARRGQTLRQVVEAALRTFLDDDLRRSQPFRLRDASVGGKGLREGLTYDDWGKILEMAYGDSA